MTALRLLGLATFLMIACKQPRSSTPELPQPAGNGGDAVTAGPASDSGCFGPSNETLESEVAPDAKSTAGDVVGTAGDATSTGPKPSTANWELVQDAAWKSSESPFSSTKDYPTDGSTIGGTDSSATGAVYVVRYAPQETAAAFRIEQWTGNQFSLVTTAKIPKLIDNAFSPCSGSTYKLFVHSLAVVQPSELWIGIDECGVGQWTVDGGWKYFLVDVVTKDSKPWQEMWKMHRVFRVVPGTISLPHAFVLINGGLRRLAPIADSCLWDDAGKALWCAKQQNMLPLSKNEDDTYFWPSEATGPDDNRGAEYFRRDFAMTCSDYHEAMPVNDQKAELPALGPQFVARVTDIYHCMGDKHCIIGGHGMAAYSGFTLLWKVDGPAAFDPIFHQTLGGGRPWVFAKDDIWWGPAHWDGKTWTTEELPKTYPKAEMNLNLDKFSKVYQGPRHLGTYWTGKDLLIVMEDGVYRRKTPPK